MWAAIFAIIQKLLGIIPDAPTAEATAESTGEDAGKAKEQAVASQKELANVAEAQDARQTVRNDLAADPGKLRADDGFSRDATGPAKH